MTRAGLKHGGLVVFRHLLGWGAAGVMLLFGLGVGLPGAVVAQDEPPLLSFFTPVTGALDGENIADEWIYDGRADEVVSLLAITLTGDLDPVLQVIGPDGVMVGRNDDLDSLVRDAGLEAFTLPLDGRYTVRVMRFQGEDGTTAGSYELTITPGFGRVARQDTFEQGGVNLSWITPAGRPVPLAQGWLRMRVLEPAQTLVALPPDATPYDDLFVQTDARIFGATSYAEFGLVVHAQAAPNAVSGYLFKVNTLGQWSVLVQDASGLFALRTWTPNPVLESSEWRLSVLARDETFSFFANGVLLGTVTDTRLPEPGMVGLLAATRSGQTDAATVHFDDVLVTTRLGTTYHGLPLALTTWDSDDPQAITEELVASGQVTPAAWHSLFLPEKTLTAVNVETVFELIGSDQAVYDDIIIGSRINIVTTGESVGCGLVYRWQDDANLSMAYVDTDGGFGIVQSQDGQLTTNVYANSSMVKREPNKLLVVVRGDQLALYVNGALVTQETVALDAGRVGVSLLNYEAAQTDCFWADIWVWPLEDGG